MSARIIVADVFDGLAKLPDESVQCVVTSPPYWGLRDYGIAGQIGLEPSPAAYIERMVAVFEAVRRVLRKDGTLWLNMGDSYTSGGRTTQVVDSARKPSRPKTRTLAADAASGKHGALNGTAVRPGAVHGLAGKQLVGIPWRLALALQEAGWWLRADIVWSKPNPMPESVTDRPTRSHEYLFLLARSARYFYDADAIAEDSVSSQPPVTVSGWATGPGSHDTLEHNSGTMDERKERSRLGPKMVDAPRRVRGSASARFGRGAGWRKSDGQDAPEGQSRMVDHTNEARAAGGDHNSPFGPVRNARTVWTIATCPYPEAHFATFPVALVKPCILAGSRHGDVVLDPFAGSGTTGLVADRLGREFVGIELNPKYARLAKRRIADDAPLWAAVDVAGDEAPRAVPLEQVPMPLDAPEGP